MSASRFILTRLCGWRIVGPFPDIPRSITIFAPHTSYFDAFFGMLFDLAEEVGFTYFIKKTFFWFPLNILLKSFGAVPVQGVKGHNAIYEAVDFLNSKTKVHILISPEGTMSAQKKWNKGFLIIARKAMVPVVVGYIDYSKKELGIKTILTKLDDEKRVFEEINKIYEGVGARHPEKFILDRSLIPSKQ